MVIESSGPSLVSQRRLRQDPEKGSSDPRLLSHPKLRRGPSPGPSPTPLDSEGFPGTPTPVVGGPLPYPSPPVKVDRVHAKPVYGNGVIRGSLDFGVVPSLLPVVVDVNPGVVRLSPVRLI